MYIGKTTRSKIKTDLVELLESLSIKRVIHNRRGSIQKEFAALPDTDFPLVVVDCGLPQPEIKYSNREQGVIEEVRSRMSIDIYVYGRIIEGFCGNENQEVSVLIETLWRGLCNSPNIGNTLKIIPTFSPRIVYESTYCYFTLNLSVIYIHDKDTI